MHTHHTQTYITHALAHTHAHSQMQKRDQGQKWGGKEGGKGRKSTEGSSTQERTMKVSFTDTVSSRAEQGIGCNSLLNVVLGSFTDTTKTKK